MSDNDKIEAWKNKVIELDGKVSGLRKDERVLADIFNEAKNGKNAKLNIILDGIDLKEEIFHLNDWIEFYSSRISAYKKRIEAAEKEGIEPKSKDLEELNKVKEEVRLLFEYEPKAKAIKPRFGISQNNLIKVAAPIVISLLILGVFFISKPEITGHAVLSKVSEYNDSLNLVINESGSYEWDVKTHGDISSIKATGSVAGNGTVKVYIEKDGKRYLIYKNK